jgi:hypothetical protein
VPGAAVELLVAVAVVAALVRRRWAVLALGVAALSEAGLFVAMTEAGFSGNPRYVLPALALACVLAGVGAANLVDAGGGLALRRPRLPAPAGAGLVVAALALLVGSLVVARSDRLANEVREVGERMNVHRDLSRAVAAEGGPGAVAALGPATANRALHSRLAWELGVSMGAVESVADYRLVSARPEKSWLGTSTCAVARSPASRSAAWAASGSIAGMASRFPTASASWRP